MSFGIGIHTQIRKLSFESDFSYTLQLPNGAHPLNAGGPCFFICSQEYSQT